MILADAPLPRGLTMSWILVITFGIFAPCCAFAGLVATLSCDGAVTCPVRFPLT